MFFTCLCVGYSSLSQLLEFNGSGDISAALDSAGIARHSAALENLQKGDAVEFYPWENIL